MTKLNVTINLIGLLNQSKLSILTFQRRIFITSWFS